MSTPVRYDQQYCPIARALDVLGDRWTLPILRELNLGDQRFTDLRAHLPGITPTVLTQRLRAMAADGLIDTRESASSRRSVYTLTERGRDATPILRSLARWGMPLLEARATDQVVRPESAVKIAVSNYYDAHAAAGIDERYRLRTDGIESVLSSVEGGGSPRDTVDVDIEASAGTWIDLRQGRIAFRDARREGLINVRGPAASVRNFQRIFQIA